MKRVGTKLRMLIAGTVIGAVLGATFVWAPVEIVVLALPASILVGIFLCVRNAARISAAGMTVAAVVVLIAAVVVTRPDPMEKRPATFSSAKVTIADLVGKGTAYEPTEADWARYPVNLPSANPTVHEIMQAVNAQTPLRASVFRCGTGTTLLQGAWVGRINLRPKKTESLVAASKS